MILIPSPEDCSYSYPPVPGIVVCSHPESDDAFNVYGIGTTAHEAYGAMIESLIDIVSAMTEVVR